MVFFSKVAANAATILLAASMAVAAPAAEPAKRDVTFKITQEKNPNFKGRTAQQAYVKALNKFGATSPSVITEAVNEVTQSIAAASASGSAVATSVEGDLEYTLPVQIGTPAQTLPLDLDTGSSDLWVFSSQTPSADVDGQTLYEIGSSSTAVKMTGATWSISYGDGSSSSGDVYTDKVSIGAVTVTSQAVESAETVSSEFVSDSYSSGLIGMGWSSINTVSPTQQKTFLANALSTLASPVMTANLVKGGPGSYTFGVIESSEYTGSITYVACSNTRGYWGLTVDGYALGSSKKVTDSFSAIADTGTTLMYLPKAIATAYWDQVSGATYRSAVGTYTFPCSATLPDISIVIGGTAFVVPGNYLNYGTFVGSTCEGGMSYSSGLLIPYILGDVFLKSQFVVFDEGNVRLGFAAKPTVSS